jgi:protein-tyrosine phosphatase
VIDLHTHLLPGVDDGAGTLAEAVAMARLAAADGVTTIVATPHRNPWSYRADRADAERRLEEVRRACQCEGIAVRLLLGGESYIAPDLPEQLETGLALTINGSRYLLIEWPLAEYPPYSDQVIFELQVRGIIPVVAHAERYRFVQRDPQGLARQVERGVLAQVTASSLLGEFGPRVRRASEDLLTRGLAHLIASDSHGPERRAPVLSRARARAAELVGEGRARALVEDVPRAIINDERVDLPPPVLPKPRPFWMFWRVG